MKLIDTHTHLYLKDFDEDIDEVIARCLAEGIEKFYLPAIESSETSRVFSLQEKYPDNCFAMVGLHPCSVKADYEKELSTVYDSLSTSRYSGIGETGLDFYWDRTFEKEQYLALEKQLEWAIGFSSPIILHTRNATQETIDVIKPHAAKGVKGIFHCFGGTLSEAKQIIEMGFYLGIGGVVTYKNSGLDRVLSDVDLEHVVLETDSPYLTPVPFRGKRNESSYLKYVAAKVAEIKGVSVEEVAEISSRNAEKVFN
ncbi:MAG: TatD family hydrolase [Ginsengibacter sp.]